jgi:hypothetical protein
LLRLGDFFALGPRQRIPELDRLADRVVVACQPLRAPLDDSELARRRAAGLTPQQDAYLVAWGYPYVFEAFRFHMTLTGPVPETDAPPIDALLRQRFASFIGRSFTIDTIALFVEPSPGMPFRIHSTARLTGNKVAVAG